MDLNESNYDYNGLLELFSLPSDFNLKHLKEAKKKVLMLHPDKSQLPNEYFLFFRKMYFKVEEIYKYTHHETNVHKLQQSFDVDTKFKDYLERHNINPETNYKRFSKEFNKMFEQVYVKESDEGHGEWLESDENIYDKNDLEKSKIQARKSQLIQVENIESVDIQNKKSLYHYDLKESHGQPFIAMDVDKVYQNTKKFNSVQELQQFQAQEDQKRAFSSDEQNLLYLKQKEDLLNAQSKQLAYQQMRQKEETENNYNKYVSRYLSLE